MATVSSTDVRGARPPAGCAGITSWSTEKVVWTKTTAEFQKSRQVVAAAQQKLTARVQQRRWGEALAALTELSSVAEEAAVRLRDVEKSRAFLAAMALTDKAPDTWTDADVERLGKSCAKVASWPFRMRKEGAAYVEGKITGLPARVRDKLAAVMIAGWQELGYRFQREQAGKLIEAVGGPEVARWRARTAAMEKLLKELSAKLEERRVARDYRGMQAVLAEIAPVQAWLLAPEFSENRIKQWVPDLETLARLSEAWGDDVERMLVLKKTLTQIVAAGADLPSQRYQPRLPGEVATHFLPRLSEAEQRAVEGHLIELGDRLVFPKQWAACILVAELIVPVAGERAYSWLPKFIESRGRAHEWQMKWLRKYAGKVQSKVRMARKARVEKGKAK
ncbi:MAG: hypothetical protein ACYTGO_19780 [Planctomycetota bacterium]